MKLEMSYRDKMILLGVSALAILLLGFFFLIKPAYEKLEKSNKAYETTKAEWDAIDMKIAQIDPLKKSITDNYNTANKTAQLFANTAFVTANETYSHEKTNYELDQYIQAAIDESKLEILEMELQSAESTEINYYYYTPNVVTYSLLEAADVNGNYAAQIAETMMESVVLSEKETAELSRAELGINVTGTKAGLMTFLDKISSDTNAVLVTGIEIEDYEFMGSDVVIGPNGEAAILVDPGEDGIAQMKIILSFYNAETIDEPDLGA